MAPSDDLQALDEQLELKRCMDAIGFTVPGSEEPEAEPTLRADRETRSLGWREPASSKTRRLSPRRWLGGLALSGALLAAAGIIAWHERPATVARSAAQEAGAVVSATPHPPVVSPAPPAPVASATAAAPVPGATSASPPSKSASAAAPLAAATVAAPSSTSAPVQTYAPVIARLREKLAQQQGAEATDELNRRENEASSTVLSTLPEQAVPVLPLPHPAISEEIGPRLGLVPHAGRPAVDPLKSARIVVHVPYGNPLTEARATALLSRLAAKVGHLEMNYVPAGPYGAEIGFYHPADDRIALELAEMIPVAGGWRVSDIGSYEPGVAPGTVEVWLPLHFH